MGNRLNNVQQHDSALLSDPISYCATLFGCRLRLVCGPTLRPVRDGGGDRLKAVHLHSGHLVPRHELSWKRGGPQWVRGE